MRRKSYHKLQAAGRWQNLSLAEQMANIGSEVERAVSWRKKGSASYSWQAFERAQELLWLTIAAPKNAKRLRELTRLRELLIDYFVGENQFSSTDELWRKYFYAFTYASRLSSAKSE